ncbi:MAG: hypothetical protein ACR2PG_21130 [Hyphomicrobiaceae bacterium]
MAVEKKASAPRRAGSLAELLEAADDGQTAVSNRIESETDNIAPPPLPPSGPSVSKAQPTQPESSQYADPPSAPVDLMADQKADLEANQSLSDRKHRLTKSPSYRSPREATLKPQTTKRNAQSDNSVEQAQSQTDAKSLEPQKILENPPPLPGAQLAKTQKPKPTLRSGDPNQPAGGMATRSPNSTSPSSLAPKTMNAPNTRISPDQAQESAGTNFHSGADDRNLASPKQPDNRERPSPRAPMASHAQTSAGGLPLSKPDPTVRPNTRRDNQHPTSQPTREQRRSALRRPAAPSRERIAANDDAPSIGGLIYALNQKPSNQPFLYAAIASGVWATIALGFAWTFMAPGLSSASGVSGLLTHPWFLAATATLLGPIMLFWFLAFLMWRTEELHLRSSAMTEVAVRLAEPDRMAEQSVASLGQTVRRQVSFMNDAVSRALGRAGELEALVHNEVSALEQSYEENEKKIRGLIQELAGERHALLNTGDRFKETLVQLGTEIPQLIEKMSSQQLKLTGIIESAGSNLSQLESALGAQSERLETTLGDRSDRLQSVLEDYTVTLGTTLGSRTEQMQTLLSGYTDAIGGALGTRTQQMQTLLEDQRATLDSTIGNLTQEMGMLLTQEREALHQTIGGSADQVKTLLSNERTAINETLSDGNQRLADTMTAKQEALNTTLAERSETMQVVFEEYARALDATLANRAESFDVQLIDRTKALDEAFAERLQLFDEAIMRSTVSIDDAVGTSAKALTTAMETHADTLGKTLSDQAADLDHTVTRGIEAVRSSSENISRQSIKAIEGLANQSDMLQTVSESLLQQINAVSNRFEDQGQSIMQSANALETANYKIDKMLSERASDLGSTLDRMSGKADELGEAVSGYSSRLEGSINDAHKRAKLLTEDLTRESEDRARAAVTDLQRLKEEATRETDRAMDDLRAEYAAVSQEVTERLGKLSHQFSQTTGEVRSQAARAAKQLEDEQDRLKRQLEQLPDATQQSTSAMRRALQDQLKALDQLSVLAQRTTQSSAATPPVKDKLVPTQPRPSRPSRPRSEPRQMNSLSDSLAQEMRERNQKPEPSPATRRPAPTSVTPSDTSTSDRDVSANWSFGDLLARASNEHEPTERAGTEPAKGAAVASADTGLDLAAIAHALERATASAIWARFRSGQRGFMVRSIYAPETRQLFDDILYRYTNHPQFRDHVDRFLAEYERGLRESDQRDPSGELTQSQIMGDTGRVYLVLAHAANRLV